MSINIVAITGRLAADPEVRSTQSGTAVCSVCVAVDGFGKDAPASFVDVVAWDKKAEFIGHYFKKGQEIAISGRLQTRNYEDKNGNKRKAVEVVAETVSFCGPKQEAAPAPQYAPQYAPQTPAYPPQAPAASQAPAYPAQAPTWTPIPTTPGYQFPAQTTLPQAGQTAPLEKPVPVAPTDDDLPF